MNKEKTGFCYCCCTTQPIKNFDKVHLEDRIKPFCKKCYIDFSDSERKERQFKYVFGIINGIVKAKND